MNGPDDDPINVDITFAIGEPDKGVQDLFSSRPALDDEGVRNSAVVDWLSVARKWIDANDADSRKKLYRIYL